MASIGRQPFERRAVGSEGAGAGGDDHGLGLHRVALVGGQREGAGGAGKAGHPAAEQPRGREGRDLRFQPRHKIAPASIAGWAGMS